MFWRSRCTSGWIWTRNMRRQQRVSDVLGCIRSVEGWGRLSFLSIQLWSGHSWMLGPVQGSPVQARNGPKEVVACLHGSRETRGNLTVVGHTWMQCLMWLCWLKSSLYLLADQLPMCRKTKREQNMPSSQARKASYLSVSDFELRIRLSLFSCHPPVKHKSWSPPMHWSSEYAWL